jgi:hypothetical protein
MSSYLEMHEIGKDPVRVRALAMKLLVLHHDELTDWEIDFLKNMSEWTGPDALSTRQAEVLVELRDNLTKRSTVDGLSVRNLIANCWLARLDLSEEDEEFIERVRGKSELNRRNIRRLLYCARELGLVERYVDLDAA